MKILVTGGMGYIGENLIRNHSDDSILFDQCDYGVVHPDLPLAHGLIWEDIEEYDAIVHLAALSGIVACENDPVKAVQENLLTSMNVFAIARMASIPVVFTSSQAAKDPTSSKYAFMKWTVEQMAKHYNNAGGKNHVLRLSNVYGGHKYMEKKQTCIKQFIKSYRLGEPLMVHGDGLQTRDFVHVDDVCHAIMNTLAFTPVDKIPIDIGTGRQISIMEVQQMFPRVENHHYEFTESRAGAKSSIADIGLAKQLIHFVTKRKLEDYIKEMIKNVN